MKNKYISASEINQFVYCPYQWYYIKKYGNKYINELREKEGFNNSELSNYKKGMEYHEKYYRDIVIMRYKKIAIWIAIALILLFLFVEFMK
ncbi:MAG: hypothetical protein QME35_00560 [Thermoanaerobacteraceae bacterium]|nr:hypothetical protein [Thermoanaerobacteraceae bacterium]